MFRCRFLGWRGGAGAPAIRLAGADQRVGYTEIGDNDGNRINCAPGRGCVRPVLASLYLHDFFGTGNGHEQLRLGVGNGDSTLSLQAVVERALFLRTDQAEGDNESVSVKSSDNVLRLLRGRRCRYVNNRFGERNTYNGVWVQGPLSAVGCRDRGNRFLGIRTTSGLGLRVQAGDITVDEWNALPVEQRVGRFVRAADTLIVRPNCHLITIGATDSGPSTLPARNTRIEANQGPARPPFPGIGRPPEVVATTTVPSLTPLDLGPDDVGVNAPFLGWPIPEGGPLAAPST